MVFLPDSLPQVRTLRGPPVPSDHIAYERCEEGGNQTVFIESFHELQHMRRDPSCAEKKPVKIYLDMLSSPFDAENEQMNDSIRAAIRRSGYQDRRRASSRCVSCVQTLFPTPTPLLI
ncbi:hypothetical protein COOONC_10585 [Cooperia oncophora]